MTSFAFEGYIAGVDFSAAVLDLNDASAIAAAATAGRYNAIVCNPPQMPGPPELASTRSVETNSCSHLQLIT